MKGKIMDLTVTSDDHSKTATDGGFQREESQKSGQRQANTLHPRVAAKMAQIPKVYREKYKKAMTGKSLRAAVDSFCVECTAYQREEVKLCTSPSCPLYPYRPYKETSKS